MKEFFSYDFMWVLLGFIFVVLVVWLYNLNKDPDSKISLIDLVATDGKLEERKISRFGAWIISSWGLVYLISINELKEWYFIGYMGAWVANALLSSYVSNSKERDHLRYGRGGDYQNGNYNERYNMPMEYEGNTEELNNIPRKRGRK